MPKIKSPESFSPNDVLTASDLQNHVDGAYPLPGIISEQEPIDSLSTNDSLLVLDQSSGQLRKATVSQVFESSIPVVTPSVTGIAGSDLLLIPQTGQKVDVQGNLEVNDITVTQNITTNGTATFNTTTAIKIPVGTTVQRPATPVAGQLRYNSTLDQAEIYSGTEWKAVGGSPFDASGGTVATIDGFKIHTFIGSGTFTPALNKEGKVEYLIVGAGGSGVLWEKGGGGGGGDVKTGFLTINKNTAPMTVTVGLGSATNGGSSSFGGITAGGGFAPTGSGWNGGMSGSLIAGTNGNNDGGAGGSGSRTAQWYRAYGVTPHAGMGGLGIGSSISGTYKEYGGGGSGSCFATGMTPNLYGGGGAYGAPEANSGGGGSGGAGHQGANGVVIIRYRVS
jgi:hypothetical protein